jgi:eukaryotic-like serine/threonine-protein kinase
MSLKNFLLSKQFYKNLGFAIMITFGAIMILLLWMNIYTRHGQARPVPNFIGLNMDQTIKLAKKSKLRFQVIDSIYSTEVQRGCIAEQSPKPGFKVKKWRNIILTINAFHPEMVAMPNLINLPKRQAILNAESAGLEIGQLKYHPDISTDMVIDQEHNGRKIQEGDSIQKGSVIDLVLGKGLSDQRTPVPDLIGLKLNTSKNKILASSLNLGTFVYDKTIVNSTDTINAFVYKQIPEYKDDASLKLGSSVYLWLTVDSTKLQTTPDITNPDSVLPAAVSDNQSN